MLLEGETVSGSGRKCHGASGTWIGARQRPQGNWKQFRLKEDDGGAD